MKEKVQWGLILGWISVAIGLFSLFLYFILPNEGRPIQILLGLGLTLFPSGVFGLLSDIYFSKIIERTLKEGFATTTSNLNESIDILKVATEYLKKSNELGILMVYKNRAEAVSDFLNYSVNYVKNPSISDKKIFFVGSSLKGVIQSDGFTQKLEQIIKDGTQNNCEFSFLLTHPAYSEYREIQESRAKGDIAKEILHAIEWLENHNISSSCIKLYKGTPTCFLVATTEKMLINPYPYQIEAYNNFCLEVEKTDKDYGIYNIYRENHFNKPWVGQEGLGDHYVQTNSLPYTHYYLDGPISDPTRKITDRAYGDLFIVKDRGSFYISVKVNGLEPKICYDRNSDGITECIEIGNILEVQLLELSKEKCNWVGIGDITLDDNTREGFLHKTISNKAIDAFSMIGVFDKSIKNANPFKHDSPNLFLKDQNLPLLWKWLTPKETKNSKS